MDQQLSFFGAPQLSFDNRLLLLVFLPDDDTRPAIRLLGETLNDKHHLHGSLRPTRNLHLTLHGLGGWSERTIRAAEKACSAATAHVAPFEVHLDCIMHWPQSKALVLTESAGDNVALKHFHKRLTMELAREIGLRKISSSFTPHISMLYCDRHIAPESVTPIKWTASKIAFICSHQGKTEHEPLGHWPLEG